MSPKLFPAACETTHPRSRPRIKPKNHNTNKPTTINIAKYIQDSAVEAPTGAAEPVPAQSIRKGRYRSLQRVKPHTPEAGHASNPKITIQTNKAQSTKSNYNKDPAVEAPTGAAEPVPAQSIRSRRLSSLQRVKHAPEAGHASNPKITIQTNKAQST